VQELITAGGDQYYKVSKSATLHFSVKLIYATDKTIRVISLSRPYNTTLLHIMYLSDKMKKTII